MLIYIEVVKHMFENEIFNLEVLETDKKCYKNSKRVTIAFHIAVSAFKIYSEWGVGIHD